MTQTQNLSNNSPNLALAVSSTSITKSKKKEEEQLLQLLSFVEQLKEEMEEIGSKSQTVELDMPEQEQAPTALAPPPPPPPPPPTGSPSIKYANNNETQASQNLIDALAQAAYFLTEIEAEIVGKFSLAASTAQTQIMQEQRTASDIAFNKTTQEIIQVEAEEAAAAKESPWAKFFSVLASVLTIVIAIVCAQPEIAALMVLTTVLNDTGETSKLVGNSLAATIAVTAVTALISGGTGALAGGARLAVALAVQNVIQELTSTNGLTNILKAIPMSDAEREKVTLGVTIGLAIVALVAAGVGASAMVKNAAAEVEDAAEDDSFLTKLKAAYRNTMNDIKAGSPTALNKMQNLVRMATAGSSVLEGIQGYQTLKTGEYTKVMLDNLSVVELMQTLMNGISKTISDRQSILSSQLQQTQSNQQVISSWLAGERAFAQTYSQSVV